MRKIGVPFLLRRKWVVDLGLGNVDLPGVPGVPDAEHLAYRAALALSVSLRPSALGPQLPLVAPSNSVTIRGAAIAWARDTQKALTDGGQKWREQYAKSIVEELGGELVSVFEPPAGNARLVAYHAHLQRKNLSQRTIRNRLSILGQILRHAASVASLSALPVMPRIRITRPDCPYPVICEVDLRAIRAAVPCHQRRLYLSVGLYLGLHASDIASFSKKNLVGGFWPPSGWIRRNTKSSAMVPDAQFQIPPPMVRDLVATVAEIGIDPPGGLTGGIWNNSGTFLSRIKRRLGLSCPVPTGRVLRRSCVWHLAAAGYTERECAEYLGHVDQRMIREIYVRFPVTERPRDRLPWAQVDAPELLRLSAPS